MQENLKRTSTNLFTRFFDNSLFDYQLAVWVESDKLKNGKLFRFGYPSPSYVTRSAAPLILCTALYSPFDVGLSTAARQHTVCPGSFSKVLTVTSHPSLGSVTVQNTEPSHPHPYSFACLARHTYTAVHSYALLACLSATPKYHVISLRSQAYPYINANAPTTKPFRWIHTHRASLVLPYTKSYSPWFSTVKGSHAPPHPTLWCVQKKCSVFPFRVVILLLFGAEFVFFSHL